MLRHVAASELTDEDFDRQGEGQNQGQDQGQDPVRPGKRGWLRLAVAVLCWVLAVAALGFAVVRVFGWERTWYGTVVMAFTPYFVVLSFVPLMAAVLLRRWRAAIVAVVASVALVSVMVPRVVGSADPARGPELRVMSSNMRLGGADVDSIISLARDHRIDLLALQEFTRFAQYRLTRAGIDTLFPYSEQDPRDGPVGSAIYSRYPLTDTGFQVLPGWFGQAYATVHVPGAVPLAVTSVHPCAPTGPSEMGCWSRGLSMEPKATPKGPVRLLLGDFNSTLDHARLRSLIDSGYEDVAAKLGDGWQPTWPYYGRRARVPLKVTLDHVLVDPRIGVSSYGTNQVPRTDHKSVHATVTLPRA